METVDIKVQRRTTAGKAAARKQRRSGTIPAILYGARRAATALSIEADELERKLARLEGSHLIRLVPAAGDGELAGAMVLLRELQRHPVSGAPLHADLYEVDLTERLVVAVPLHFVGKAAGVVAGGILQPVLRDIEVECLPTEIPEFVEVDVSALGIHEAVHLADIRLPEGVSLVGEGSQTVVTVLPPTVEEKKPEVAPAEGAPVEGVAPEAAAAPAAETAPAGAKKPGGEG